MQKKVLLCIDDEATGLKIRKLILESSGFHVLTAESGAAGLSMFRERPVDAVILDYFMPEMDGGQVADEMKRLKPAVPILMLSAYFSLPEGALRSVDAFITKGERTELLLETISRLLKLSGNGQQA